jgi:hypothetical protein
MITRRTHKRESISLIGELGKRGKNMYLDGVVDLFVMREREDTYEDARWLRIERENP